MRARSHLECDLALLEAEAALREATREFRWAGMNVMADKCERAHVSVVAVLKPRATGQLKAKLATPEGTPNAK